MITESTIYWLTRLDPIHNLLTGFLVFSVIATPLIVGAQMFLRDVYQTNSSKEENVALANKLLYLVLPSIIGLFLLCLVGKTFLPTMKEMCAIKVIPAIANNEKLQNLGSDVYDLAVDWMKELKPAPQEK